MAEIVPGRSSRRRLARTVLAAGAALAVMSGALVAGGAQAAQSRTSSSPEGASTSSGAGVGELLVVKLSPTGAVSAKPYQHTEVTASSTGTVKVEVPMSASGMRLLGGHKPTVKNSVGQFSLTPNGTATQNVRSDFADRVPLTVKAAYELNGQPIQASALAPTRHFLRKHYKSGTLKVTYVLSNISKVRTKVAFEGFNGAHIRKKITDPLPIVAELKLTFPKDATNIQAPGASLATGKLGAKATWTIPLAPPLSGASKSISYSVHLSKAKAPEATVEAEVLVPPSAPSGKVPQTVAAALGSVEGQPEPGLGGSPVSLGQVRSDLSRPQRSTNSQLASRKRALTHANRSKRNSSVGKIKPSLNHLTRTQARDEQNTVSLGDAQVTSLGDAAGAQLNGLRDGGDAQLNGLSRTANRAVAVLATEVASGSAQANASVGAVLSHFMAQLASSITSLSGLVSSHVAHQANAVASANALTLAVTALGALINGLVTVVNQHASDATALDKLIVQLIADANAFPPAVQSTHEWIKLSRNLAAAKSQADLVRNVAADIAQRTAALSTAMQKVHGKAVALEADIRKLSAEAAGIQSQLTNHVMSAERNLEASIARVSGQVKNFQGQIAAAQSSIGRAIGGVRAKIGQATSSISAKIGQATSSIQATLNAAGQKAHAALARGKQKLQATVHKAVGSVQEALNKANADYAQLLALAQIAQAHQLPSGDATGAKVQNGAYVLRISGTG